MAHLVTSLIFRRGAQKRPTAVVAAKIRNSTPPTMPMTRSERYLEMKEPPTKSDEKNCNVRYRIEPSGMLCCV